MNAFLGGIAGVGVVFNSQCAIVLGGEGVAKDWRDSHLQ